ncbi:hypothetical protein P3S68_003931 [Capsicum galapagoense]
MPPIDHFSRASFLRKGSVHYTTPSNGTIQSNIILISGEYLIKISIGTSPRETFAIADIGSDLTWGLETFYFLNLKSVSVGGKKLEFKSSQPSSSVDDENLGNIIINSSTTLTFIANKLYNKLESTLVKIIKRARKEDPFGDFGLCYDFKKPPVNTPKIVSHFKNTDIELLPENTFAEVDEGLTCLTIVSECLNGAIYGNLALTNFHIGYDLANHKISFLPTDWTKH